MNRFEKMNNNKVILWKDSISWEREGYINLNGYQAVILEKNMKNGYSRVRIYPKTESWEPHTAAIPTGWWKHE